MYRLYSHDVAVVYRFVLFDGVSAESCILIAVDYNQQQYLFAIGGILSFHSVPCCGMELNYRI